MHNTIVALGHLVADPTTQHTQSGKAICRMRVCISDNSAKNKCFIDVEAWEKLAEVCQQYLVKGREVYIEGELSSSSWEKDGQKQTKNFIRAKTVKFLKSGGAKGDSLPSEKGSNKPAAPTNLSSQADEDDDIPF
jgi:single-strand DNA-binding protein